MARDKAWIWCGRGMTFDSMGPRSTWPSDAFVPPSSTSATLGGCRNIGNSVGFNLRVKDQRLKTVMRNVNPDHRVLVRQPDTANGLSPQGLFLDNLAGAVVNGRIEPQMSTNGHQSPGFHCSFMSHSCPFVSSTFHFIPDTLLKGFFAGVSGHGQVVFT